jgi:3-methyladenine DNA glycosylase AlkD
MRNTTATLSSARSELGKYADAKKALTYRGFFKNCTDDIFLGVTAPQVRLIAVKQLALPLTDIRTLTRSRIHEERSLAHAILVLKFKKGDEKEKKSIFDFYLKNRRTIRDWDGVDDSTPAIVGTHLLDKKRDILYDLIASPHFWDRRIALVATLPMIRRGQLTDTYRLVRQVLHDEEDLIHKAAGWMLREAGKKDPAKLRVFLRTFYPELPRTTLRYAIERFPEAERQRYLKGKFTSKVNIKM